MMSIGALAEKSGCNVQTIRYYEQIGLIVGVERSAGNQRRYTAAALERLRFIRRGRDLGFSVGALRELLELADHRGRSCAEVDAIARAHLATVRHKLSHLQRLEAALDGLIGQCRHGRIEDCAIIETLTAVPDETLPSPC